MSIMKLTTQMIERLRKIFHKSEALVATLKPERMPLVNAAIPVNFDYKMSYLLYLTTRSFNEPVIVNDELPATMLIDGFRKVVLNQFPEITYYLNPQDNDGLVFNKEIEVYSSYRYGEYIECAKFYEAHFKTVMFLQSLGENKIHAKIHVSEPNKQGTISIKVFAHTMR